MTQRQPNQIKIEYTAIDVYYNSLINSKDKRLYCIEFIKGNLDPVCRNWFKEALNKSYPELIEWFDRMLVFK